MKSNQITISGNVGGNPEHHKKCEDSPGVVTFSVAENVSKINDATKKFETTHTNWFPVRAFGSLGQRVMANLRKGDRVTIHGSLRTFTFEGAGGMKVSGFEILADDVSFSEILRSLPSQCSSLETV